MSVSWKLNVASPQPLDGWYGEAQRLQNVLDTVSRQVEIEYGFVLLWRNEDLTTERWQDTDTLATYLKNEELRDDFGKLMVGAGSNCVVQGYRQENTDASTNALVTAGTKGEWTFVCTVTFYAGDTACGMFRTLPGHRPEWLVRLLCEVAHAAHATIARIRISSLSKPLRRARPGYNVGVLTLAPHGVDVTALPVSITAHPCPVGYPDGLVLAADLDLLAADPAALVDDLLVVDDLLRQAG